MSLVFDDVQITSNPATGVEVGRVKVTPTDQVAEIVARARSAQRMWAEQPWNQRRRVLTRWWRILSRDVDRWTELIRDEIGKPPVEALAGDVVSTLDGIRWTIKNAGRTLRDERISSGWQRWMLMPRGRLRWSPVGVVGIIGTWNYPLFLNAPAIAQALAAGNGVVWKPSELAVRTGQRIQHSLEEAGLPAGLVTAVYGGAEVGQALVEADIDKAVFTGGIDSGRRVLATLGARGVPAIAELSGFDPAIVLPDSPPRSTVRALTWAAFVGCGQTCVAVKRVYVVGDASPWAERFAAQARALKVGNPAEPGTDLGPMISAVARDRFDRMIQSSIQAGARVLAGAARVSGPGWFYAPTVLQADTPDAEAALAGAFGPVVAAARSSRRRRRGDGGQRQRVRTWSKRVEPEPASRPGSRSADRGRNGLCQRCRDPHRTRRRTLWRVQGQWLRSDPRRARAPRVRPAAGLLRSPSRRLPAPALPVFPVRDRRAFSLLILPDVSSSRLRDRARTIHEPPGLACGHDCRHIAFCL